MSYHNQKTYDFLREQGMLLNIKNNNRIILWRHGETSSNAKGLICGSGEKSFNIPINIIGKEHATFQINRLKTILGINISEKPIIISSPQPRAIETAEILTSWLKTKIQARDFLKEINCGKFEGKPYNSNPPAPDEYVTTQKDGEHYLYLCNRIYLGMKKTLLDCSQKTLLISTHGTTGSIINQMFGNKYTSLGNVELLEYNNNLKLIFKHQKNNNSPAFL